MSPALLLHLRDRFSVPVASPERSRAWLVGFATKPSSGKVSMTLEFPNHSRSYDRTRQAVRFWGYDSSIEYSFFVTVGALERVEPRLRRDEEGFLGAFDAHRDLIFQTAAAVHSRDRKGRYELVGTDFR